MIYRVMSALNPASVGCLKRTPERRLFSPANFDDHIVLGQTMGSDPADA
jgi:hypothetical protein